MGVANSRIDDFWTTVSGAPGPVTKRHLKRTLSAYLGCVLLGLLPVLVDAPGEWQAAGLGLWLPGAGFLGVGGWAALLFPLTLVLFAVSAVAWFWAGMVVAPVIVWLGSASIAGLIAPEDISPLWHPAVGTLVLTAALAIRQRAGGKHHRDEATARARERFLPVSLAEVRARSSVRPDPSGRELSASQLESLRYVLDRALQPVNEFSGFDIIDQFQPAALRYQLNHMGFALGVAQGAYLPNFHGYMHRAQQNLIEKYLLRKVWGYWVWESCWGHLNFTDFDPAGRDNIMLTGWFGMHVGQYLLNSGDRRYAEPGSLTFVLNERTRYQHDLHTIVGSVVNNYEHYQQDFCLYPCEPNWIYPICNHYGMTALACHDRLFSTDYVSRFLSPWLEKLDKEFTDRSGSIIGLRSRLTGLPVPFPVREYGYAFFANCFAPDRGERLWAIARKELEPALVADEPGHSRLSFPGRGLDPGNYRTGFAAIYGSIMVAAREFGDHELAQAAQRSLDRDCSPHLEGGSLSYLGGSNISNANIVMARLMDTGDFRRSFVEGPAGETLRGPCLTGVEYPEVLVARAYSSGSDLDLVLYPGDRGGIRQLTVERLRPGMRYQVTGASEAVITANASGQAKLSVQVRQRTPVNLTPLGAEPSRSD